MRVLITGSREWKRGVIIETLLAGMLTRYPDLVVIEGCARGADRVACRFDGPGLTHLHFPAEWTKYGKPAGAIRNRQQFDEGKPDVVFAFHDNLEESSGTKDMVQYAHKQGAPVYVIGKYNG